MSRYLDPSSLEEAMREIRVSRSEIDRLQTELTAEREAREKLEIELADIRKMRDLSAEDTFKALQRAESAEARIKASREQEPVVFCNGDELDYLLGDESGGAIQLVPNANGWQKTPLYKQPIIPPELAELHRDLRIAKAHEAASDEANKTLAKEIAELRSLLSEARNVPEEK